VSHINSGGAAFPRPASEYTKNGTLNDGNEAIDAQGGMSLRDYFAGQALAGFASSYRKTDRDERSHPGKGELIDFSRPDCEAVECCTDQPCESVAETCYVLADAMLKARKAVLP
jgi:hypothetical protein